MGGDSDRGLPLLWDMDSTDYECDCPGPPPPPFRLPPPPRPPFLHELSDCSEAPLLEIETCDAMPVIDAEYHSSPALPSIAVIVVCALLLLGMLLIATALVWKHKKKMQNFLPCKSSPQNRCDVAHGNGVIYEDLANIRPRPLPQPSMEMLDVKLRAGYGGNYPVISHSPVFICPPSHPHPHPHTHTHTHAHPHPHPLPLPVQHHYCSQDLYNPVYEELSNGSGERGDSDPESECGPAAPASEDEFAEDELSLGGDRGQGGVTHSTTSSLQGSTGNDLCRDIDSSDADDRSRFLGTGGRNLSLPPGQRSRGRSGVRVPRGERRPRSLDRRRANNWRSKAPECGEFHEGLLLDALLQLAPPRGPMPPHRLPYILPVPPTPHYAPHHRHQEFTTFRPSQDSDSGYSNNTSGGRGYSRGRKDSHRLPHSSDLVLS